MPLTPRPFRAWRATLAAVFLFVAPAVAAGPSDADLLVSPASPILDGLQSMSVGTDVSTLFEAREIFRLAHRDDAVAAIDRHLERVAAARATGAPMPASLTIGDVLRASTEASEAPASALTPPRVDWGGADRVGVERARRWLADIGCERRAACKDPTATERLLHDPKVLWILGALAVGIVVALPFGAMRRYRLRSALGATAFVGVVGLIVLLGSLRASDAGLVVIVLPGFAVLLGPPYLAGLVATLWLMKRLRGDRPEAADAPVA